MMAFILATDFDFIAYMSKMAFFWKLFSRQWRFWNMIQVDKSLKRVMKRVKCKEQGTQITTCIAKTKTKA